MKTNHPFLLPCLDPLVTHTLCFKRTDLAGTALGVAGPPAWVWSPGAGEGGVSPKTQGMVGSEVTQVVLRCRLVPDDGTIEDFEHTVSFECMHDGACGRHEVNTNAYTRLWPLLPIAGKSSQLADLLLEVVGCGYTWVCVTPHWRAGCWPSPCCGGPCLAPWPPSRLHGNSLHREAVGFLTESSICVSRQLQLSGSSLH